MRARPTRFSRVQPRRRVALALACVGGALALGGCGGSDDEGGAERSAPAATEFPPARGRTLADLARGSRPSEFVVSPAGQVFDIGTNRFAFGVFTLEGEQVDNADIALYFAPGATGRAIGPFPARVDSLTTPAAFRSRTTATDAGAATSVYVVEGVEIARQGEWRMLALIRQGGELTATRLPSVVVGRFPRVPDVGDPAPGIHTPTVGDVGEISEIETRDPPDSMHEVDFADALGEKPILLVFATPALCHSRVCGPTVDIAEQVKSEFGEEAAFIHMEIYNDNDPAKGLRPQVRAFHLPTEPWAFIVDAEGRIAERLEGAFGATELSQALAEVTQ